MDSLRHVERFEKVGLPILKALLSRFSSLRVCSFGLACALLTWFPGRFGVSVEFSSAEVQPVLDSAAMLLLAVMAFIWSRRPNAKLSRSKAFIAFTGAASALCFALFLTPVLSRLDISGNGAHLIEALYRLGSTLLLLLWLEQSDELSTYDRILTLGLSCFALAVLELVILCTNVVVSQVIFVVSPIMSMAALLVFVSHRQGDFACERAKGAGEGELADGGLRGDGLDGFDPLAVSAFDARTVASVVVLCLGVLVFVIAGSSIHAYLTHSSSVTASSVVLGVSDMVGLVLASLAFVGLAVFVKRDVAVTYVLLTMPTLLALAYVMSAAAHDGLAFPAFAVLAVMRRSAFLFWLVAALACPRHFKVAAAFMLVAYHLAQKIGFLIIDLDVFSYGSDTYTLLIFSELLLTAMLCVLIAIACLRHSKTLSDEGGRWCAFEAVSDGKMAMPDRAEAADSQVEVLDGLAAEYGLSNREREVLALLAERWRASAIAEKLFISPSTAKNHMGSIYSKIGIHSQDELLHLVEARRESAKVDDV